MCKAPIMLPTGVETACHKCSQCRERAIDDWVGRNIAESRTSKWARAVTLTYGRSDEGSPDHERAAILTYSDVQKWIKLLRRHGFDVRYFITGEFGSTKGRAHWHVMLYGQGSMPEHRLEDKYFVGAFWSHGFSYWTMPDHRNIRYNCKYILKDMGDEARQGHLAMSKKPPLGARYFDDLAERYVRQGLAPQDLFYSFPEVRQRKRDGSEAPKLFMLKDRSAELFLDHYLATWRARRGSQPVPGSELLEAYEKYGVFGYPDDLAQRRELETRELEVREREAARKARKPPRVYDDSYLQAVAQAWEDHWRIDDMERGSNG